MYSTNRQTKNNHIRDQTILQSAFNSWKQNYTCMLLNSLLLIYFFSIPSRLVSPDLSSPFVQLRELQDKYAECMEMLNEAQEELKNLRNKTLPLSTPRRFHSLGLFPMVNSYSSTSVCHNISMIPAATKILWHFLPSSPGLSGSRNRGHHEEGTSDGWSGRRGAEVLSLKRK